MVPPQNKLHDAGRRWGTESAAAAADPPLGEQHEEDRQQRLHVLGRAPGVVPPPVVATQTTGVDAGGGTRQRRGAGGQGARQEDAQLAALVRDPLSQARDAAVALQDEFLGCEGEDRRMQGMCADWACCLRRGAPLIGSGRQLEQQRASFNSRTDSPWIRPTKVFRKFHSPAQGMLPLHPNSHYAHTIGSMISGKIISSKRTSG